MDEDSRMIGLTAATLAGLGVALLARYVLALPEAVTIATLGLAYLAGGVPAGIEALRELFGRGKLDIDLLMVIAAVAVKISRIRSPVAAPAGTGAGCAAPNPGCDVPLDTMDGGAPPPPEGGPPVRGSPDCRRRSASSGPGRSAA